MVKDEYYDEIAASYDELYKKEQVKKLRLILKNIKLNPGDKVLDVGCGTAFSLDYFGADAVGLDESIELLKKAGSRVVCARAENIPFKDHCFDLVISVTAMHHFDLEKAVPEILRVGKTNFVFSILKRASAGTEALPFIKKFFDIYKEISEDKDLVLFCRPKF